eukprot:2895459-Prymnesium_polylepis.1
MRTGNWSTSGKRAAVRTNCELMGNKSWTRSVARSPGSVEDAVASTTDVPEVPGPLAAASPDGELHGNATTPNLAAAAKPPAEADAFDIVELQVEPGEDDEDGA